MSGREAETDPIFVSRIGPPTDPERIWLHGRDLRAFAELSIPEARELVFELAEHLGLKAYNPVMLGEVAE
ncbi:hypothetical protein [Streptomyces decoyicus]|uniref:hypothetical protein n=1 Tax=Streptomyces decoyicus TaxID=249567 RepID=UPI00386E0278|nr:hypothetical protein OG532_16730 [Streptomyces decoyicus]